MNGMKPAIVLFALLIAGCATTPAGLSQTRVEATVPSDKPAAAFATCVAESLAGNAELRSDGTRYWVLRSVAGTPRHRWDFIPAGDGSIAELRSTALAGGAQDKVRACA